MDLIPARVLVALVIFTSCADPSLREPSVGASTPDTATIRCDDDGSMEVLTPAVQAQPDGVHIEVHVPEDSDLGFSVRECCGFNAEDGSFIVPVPPGRMNVGCLTPEQDAGDDSLYHEIRVVDKEGAYISDELRCEGAMGVGSGDAGPSAGEDLLTAARALLTGLQPSDDLVQVGYVERRSAAAVAVRRDDEVIAIIRLEPSGGGWGWIGFESCPNSGISY